MRSDRLLIVSNRLPIIVEKRRNKLQFQKSAGGLATGLSSIYRTYESIWVGWPGISLDKINTADKKDIQTRLRHDFNCHPVFLSHNDVEKYYYGFSNKTLWPAFHYFTQYTVYDEDLWKAYKQVNIFFSEIISEITNEGDVIWIHDYHLMLLPFFLRKRFPNSKIGYFQHIPFPSFEIFRLLPWRKEILEGLLGADIIGFHTYDYTQHFLRSVHHLMGYEHRLGHITLKNRIVKADAFPMGIDCNRFSKAVGNKKVQKEREVFRKNLRSNKIILSIDRLDYTKGILQRLDAFDIFLKRNPEYKTKVTLILAALPSRTKVEHYNLLKKQVDELISRINGEYGTIGWVPIQYLCRSLSFDTLIALYSIADVALVTPLRDGMNLVAKEYIATKTDGKGSLILSEMAGASQELIEAILVNPNDKEKVARALKESLIMPEKTQIENNREMQKRLMRYDIKRWAGDFLDSLSNIVECNRGFPFKRFDSESREQLLQDYRNTKNRLILLDYDGTLIPFADTPEKAIPDNDLLTLLEVISKEPKNELFLLSGRNREFLDKWFDGYTGLVAEHGVWIKWRKGKWELIEPLNSDWKKDVRHILETYVDRTPGSFIEEKDFSLAWHYRKVDPDLAFVRAMELQELLLDFTSNLSLELLEGKKVIEIKNAGINKGTAALHIISKHECDYILAVGDDKTDEYIFEVLPEWAYSIRVGLKVSKARFNVSSYMEVRDILKLLD